MIDVVVTGASGFIGTRLVDRLRKTGAEVLALAGSQGDVADPATWEDIPPARVVVHLAGRSYVPDSWKDSVAFLHTNVVGTEQVLAYCRRTGAAMVMASAYLYGIPDRLPISEQDTPKPNNPYALSKWLAEELCEFASRYHQVSVTALRIFNVYGPGQRSEFLIPSIIEQVRSGDAIRLQDLSPRRDYVYVDDVVDAMMFATQSPSGFNRINIGSGVSYSVADVVAMIQRVAGSDLSVISAGASRPQEIPDVRADISEAKRILGWQPRHTFEDGIRQIILESAS